MPFLKFNLEKPQVVRCGHSRHGNLATNANAGAPPEIATLYAYIGLSEIAEKASRKTMRTGYSMLLPQLEPSCFPDSDKDSRCGRMYIALFLPYGIRG